MKTSRAVSILACCLALLSAAGARAATVNLATGLDSSGALQLGGGLFDAFWQVTGAVSPLDPPYAYVVGDFSGDTGFPLWVANGPDSSWIAANPDNPRGNGLLTFTREFYVNDPATASIDAGAWAIDDIGALTLNGNLLATLDAFRTDPYALYGFSTTPSDFVTGLNVLTIQITETDFYVEGARLEGVLIGDVGDIAPFPPPPPPPPPSVPEPASWVLMTVGVGLVGLALRRRRAGLGSVLVLRM